MLVAMAPTANPMLVVVTPINVLRQLRIGASAYATEARAGNTGIGDIGRTKGNSSERRCRNQAFFH